MKIKIKLDDGAFAPERAHETDAGLDLRTPRRVECRTECVIDTGVHIEIPKGFYGKIESKSGLNVNHSIVSCGGVIDEGYTGSIRVKLYNLGMEDYVFEAGDKIAQFIILPCLRPELEQVEELEETERGDRGFGSTGR